MRRPNIALRYFIMVIVVGIAMLLYIGNLVNLQVVHGEENSEKAQKNDERHVTVMAARGEILDRNGKLLAENAMGYALIFDSLYMNKKNQNDTIQRLLILFEETEETWVDEFPIVVKGEGYAFKEELEKETTQLREFLRVNTYATADNCMEHLIKKYELDKYDVTTRRAMAAVRYQMERKEFSIPIPYVFAENVSIDTVSRVKENSTLFPGVDVRTITIRQYPNGTLAPHLIGTVGAIDKEEYAEKKDLGYLLNDTLGKSGIEKAMEEYLRGKTGEKIIYTGDKGQLVNVDEESNMPTPGNSVILTLDADLQKIANQALKDNIEDVAAKGRSERKPGSGEDCNAGAMVVLDAKNFEVLASSTYPSFDLATYKDEIEALSKDEAGTPLVNRALHGAYAPGSTMKPSIALAGLQENELQAGGHIFCSGTYDFYKDIGYTPKCLGRHGGLDVVRALTKSCNVFFYETGRRLTIERMNLYGKRLGLGQKTGVEVDERTGILAGREEREAQGKSWAPGDTIQAAIGQSDNIFTPMQYAVYAATIANGGTRYEAHFVKEVKNYSRDKVVYDKTGAMKVVDNLGVSPENIETVKLGMQGVCKPGGTAGRTFAGFNIPVAGKTGTAQVPKGTDNAVFICFAPANDPQIAIAVVLEHGAHGGWAAPAARDVMEYYFNKKDTTSLAGDESTGGDLGQAAIED